MASSSSSSSSILSIDKLAVRDDSIIKKEIYQYTPYTTSIGENDEIRIAIQSKDAYLLPSESYLYMRLLGTSAGAHVANDAQVQFALNFASFMFTDARYELNGVEVDRVRNVGRATTMKLMTASSASHLNGYDVIAKAFEISMANRDGPRHYDVVLPLSVLFGFCDDYRKIIVNCKHELILNRARTSLDLAHGGADRDGAASVTFQLEKIEWKMPHITLADPMKLNMLNYLSKNRKITVQHRSMDMIEYPALPEATSHMWAVKTVPHVNRPRYVIVAFQTERNNVRIPNASKFDSCGITQVRLHLNAQTYPYNMNDYNFAGGVLSDLYHNHAKIQSSYYGDANPVNPFCINFANFQSSPLFAFDTSRADESLIDSPIDVRIEIKASDNIPPNTSAYCLIVYDNEFTYAPFEGIVTRKI